MKFFPREKHNPPTEKSYDLKTFSGISSLSRDIRSGIIACAKGAFGTRMSEREVVEHLDGEVLVATCPDNTVAGFAVHRLACLWR